MRSGATLPRMTSGARSTCRRVDLPRRAPEWGSATSPLREKVARGLQSAARVVGIDMDSTREFDVRRDDDGRKSGRGAGEQVVIGEPESGYGDDEALNAPLEEKPQVGPLVIFRARLDAADDEEESVLARLRVRAGDGLGEEVIAHVGRDHAERVRSARRKAARHLAGDVLQLADRVRDALASLRRHAVVSVDHTRHRLVRHLGFSGDIADRGAVHVRLRLLPFVSEQYLFEALPKPLDRGEIRSMLPVTSRQSPAQGAWKGGAR